MSNPNQSLQTIDAGDSDYKIFCERDMYQNIYSLLLASNDGYFNATANYVREEDLQQEIEILKSKIPNARLLTWNQGFDRGKTQL